MESQNKILIQLFEKVLALFMLLEGSKMNMNSNNCDLLSYSIIL